MMMTAPSNSTTPQPTQPVKAAGGALYRANMDLVIQALTTAELMLNGVSEDDITHMLNTVGRDEAMGFMFVKPIEFDKTMDGLSAQRELLELAQTIKQTMAKVKDQVTGTHA